MKKKAYIQPCLEENYAQAEQMLAGSVTGAVGIGYGGTDSGGTRDPEVKECDWDIWGE